MNLSSRVLYLLALITIGSVSGAADRPNVVWIISEDSSKHYFQHFDAGGAATPNIEALAQKGVTFDHAFSNAPVCSVARTTLLTGCYGPRIGTQFHRAIGKAHIPKGLTLFPARLKAAGYFTTNNAKEDYNVVIDQDVWHDSSKRASWRQRPTKETPFFHVQTFTTSHESSLHFPETESTASKDDLSSVEVPAYLPDTPLIRYTKARYQDRIQAVDEEVGKLVEQLHSDGLLDSTFVFYFGDHGGVLPRSKGYLYETGLHVPLVVRIPEKYRQLSPFPIGSRSHGFVEFVDFSATALALAGLEPSSVADGKAFLGADLSAAEVEARNETLGYADRFDEKYELVRSLRVGKYKYIRSFEPFTPDGLQNNYRYEMLAYQHWRTQFKAGALNEIQAAFFLPKPAERLFDVELDPDETNNLADDASLADDTSMGSTLIELRNRLTAQLKAMPDLSLYPESLLIEQAFQDPIAFGQSHQQAIAKLIDIANLAFADHENQAALRTALQSDDPWQRYRAAIVCAGLKAIGDELQAALLAVLDDPQPLVAVRAAQALATVTNFDPRPSVLSAIKRSKADTQVLEILNCVVQLNDRRDCHFPFSANEVAANMTIKPQGEIGRRVEYLRTATEE